MSENSSSLPNLRPRDDADDAQGGDNRRRGPTGVNGGRLGIYAAMGASTGVVPLPWVPGALARRVRGSLVQDVAARHGLTLERDAREVLVNPSGGNTPRGAVGEVLRFVGGKIAMRALTGFGPIGLFWPLRAALDTYVLGHLFDRYLEKGRLGREARMDAGEARRVRTAVDRALVRALTVDVDPFAEPISPRDMRDEATAFIDGVLSLAAGVPERLIRRLDAAFDDIIGHDPG